MREDIERRCPACHERIPITINPARGSKTWIEECCVCDTPLKLRLVVDEDDEDDYTLELAAVDEDEDDDIDDTVDHSRRDAGIAETDDGDGDGEAGVHEVTVTCPACWEEIPLLIDLSAGVQKYSEDCSVCCRPMTVQVQPGDDGEPPIVEVEAESD